MLEIKTSRIEPDITVVEINGRITIGRDCKQLEWTTESLVRDQARKIILDLSRVTQIDSTGIGIIVMSAAQVKNSGGELRIAGANGHVEQVLRMTSLEKVVPLHASIMAASTTFQQ
jgi:anti-sigma B factor antagonist